MSRKSRDVYSNKLFGAGQGKAVAARHLESSAFAACTLPPAGKRKSDDPCRWVIAFLVPCGTGRVNDKKVNEENSKVKTKAHTEPKLPLQREDVSKLRFCWIQHTTLEQKLQEVF